MARKWYCPCGNYNEKVGVTKNQYNESCENCGRTYGNAQRELRRNAVTRLHEYEGHERACKCPECESPDDTQTVEASNSTLDYSHNRDEPDDETQDVWEVATWKLYFGLSIAVWLAGVIIFLLTGLAGVYLTTVALAVIFLSEAFLTPPEKTVDVPKPKVPEWVGPRDERLDWPRSIPTGDDEPELPAIDLRDRYRGRFEPPPPWAGPEYPDSIDEALEADRERERETA